MDDKLLTDRRDLVIDRLSSGYAQGVFEVEELERRLVRAHDAQSARELEALGPVVQIVGRVRLGNLEVETRRPGETARDARRRRRIERRAYRRWRHARERWMW